MTAQEDLFAQELLASAKSDGLSPARKAALATALGMGAAASAGVAGAGAVGAAGAAASKAKIAVGMAIVKWLGIVTVGGVAVASATTAIVHHERAEQSLELSMREHAPRTTSRAAPATPPVGPAMPETPAAPAPALEPAPLPQTEPAPLTKPAPAPEAPTRGEAIVRSVPRRPTPAEPAPPPAVPDPMPAEMEPAPVTPQAPPPRLATEQRTIEAARRAMANGDIVAARRALDAHDAEFPHGVLAQEAEVLRIELLARSGQRDAARAAASSLLARAPSGPYASRLRVLAGD